MAVDYSAELDKRYGYSSTPQYFAGAQYSNSNFAKQGNQQPPKITPLQTLAGFAGDVGKSIGSIGSGALHGIIDSFKKPITGTATGILQGLPGIGSINQNEKFRQQRLNDLNHAFDTYSKAFKAGKISKDRYNKLLKDLGSEYQKASGQAAQDQQTVAPKQFATDLIATGMMPFAFGKLRAANPGALSPIEAAATKIPFSGLQKTFDAGKQGSVAGNVAAGLLKQPLLNVPAAQTYAQLGADVKNKQFAKAAKDAVTIAGLAAAPNALSKVGSGAKSLIYNTHGLFDSVKLKGGQTVTQAYKGLKAELGDSNPKLVSQIERKLKVIQDLAYQEHGNDPQAISKLIGQYQPEASKFENQDLMKFIKNFDPLIANRRIAQKYSKQLTMPDGSPLKQGAIALGRFSNTEKKTVMNRLLNASDMQKEFRQLKREGFLKNKNLSGQIEDLLKSTNDREVIRRSIANITSSTPLNAPDEVLKKFKNGYFPVLTKKAGVVRSANEVGPLIEGKKAALGGVGNTLRKLGISTEGTPPGIGVRIGDNMKKELAKLPGYDASRYDRIYGKLVNKSIEGKSFLGMHYMGAPDVRMLNKGAVQDVLRKLGIPETQWRNVRKALDRAYTSASAAERGLGPKVTDQAIRRVPGMRQYLKAQSYGRFNLNPFFKGKVMAKSEALAQAYSGGHNPLGKVSNEVSQYITENYKHTLEQSVIDFAGEAIPTNVKPGLVGKLQQHQAGTMIQQILKNNNKDLNYLKAKPDSKLAKEIDHAVQSIYGYPKGGFTDSGMAKTLNIVLFPLRFEAKVLGAGVKFMKQQPPIRRAEIVNSLLKAKEWSNSPEGKQWKRDNSELIGLMNYFTPTKTIGDFVSLIEGKHNLKDLGSIGGLPFGVITQILEHQGVPMGPLKSSPYPDPKTGVIVSDKIPDTTKARLQQGLTDLIGSLFSYPGKNVGLPSKNKTINYFMPFTKMKPGEFHWQTPEGAQSEGGQPTKTAPALAKPYKPTEFKPYTAFNQVKPISKAKKASSKGKKPKVYAKPIGSSF